MKRLLVLVGILALLGCVSGAGWWYINRNPEWRLWLREQFAGVRLHLGLASEKAASGVQASGFVEAEDVSVTSELGGRILGIWAGEGDDVVEGQVLVQLDDSLLSAQTETAQAEVAVAEAMLAQVKAGARPETVEHAQAVLGKAKAAQEAARIAWEDAKAVADHPQELELAIAAARAQVEVLTFREKQALALANAADTGLSLATETLQLLEEYEPQTIYEGPYPIVVELPADALPSARRQQALAAYQSWEDWTALSRARAAREAAQSYLAQLLREQDSPLALTAQVNAAASQYEIATSAVSLSQAHLDGLQIGATREQIAAAEAQVEVARAAEKALRVQIPKLALRAPISGLVLARPARVGELAVPGTPLLSLASLDHLSLTIYVPEYELGRVRIGQAVSTTVDAYPDRSFLGTVVFVAGEAEFTPKNVETREERANMVFAVKVQLPNSDHALKPGMPADAIILTDQQ